jgi:hypothetical protein
MADVITEVKAAPKADDTAKHFHSDLWHMFDHSHSKTEAAVPAVPKPTDNKAANGTHNLLPTDLEQNLKSLQQNLEKTQSQIAELQKNCNSGLYDLELSRRSMVENPYKILTAGSGLAMLTKSPGLASIPLTGFAALQGYDDFKNLRDQTTFAGRGKYTLGLMADTAVGAGSLAFLTDSVPMKYKAPLLLGGMVARAAIDFIPNKK